MKHPALTSLAALAFLTSSALASNVDPIFFADQGILVIPNLKLGNQTYSVVLNRIGSSWDFHLDTSSINNFNLSNLGYTPPTTAEIIGTWTSPDMPGASFTLNTNGTYTLNAVPDSQDCPSGGLENGTYQYEPTTGVFSPVATDDHNGKCGWSIPNSINILKKIGSDFYYFFRDHGVDNQIKIVK